MDESEFITGNEYEEIMTEYENETNTTRVNKRKRQSTPTTTKSSV